MGRPAKTRQLIIEALAASTIPLTIIELSKRIGVPYAATQQALIRATKKGDTEHVESHGYRLAEATKVAVQPSSDIRSVGPDLNLKDHYENTHTLKGETFVVSSLSPGDAQNGHRGKVNLQTPKGWKPEWRGWQ